MQEEEEEEQARGPLKPGSPAIGGGRRWGAHGHGHGHDAKGRATDGREVA